MLREKTQLLPAGYLYKKVVPPAAWMDAAVHIANICSVSGCVAESFMDYIDYWRHNSLFFFDEPALMRKLAQEFDVNLECMALLYFEMHPEEYNELKKCWVPINGDIFPTDVVPPEFADVLGFDVVSFSMGYVFECSPLSCNDLHAKLTVNSHCLFPTFQAARDALEGGKFEGVEPGPYRIFSVARVDAPTS
jgi:hypothetical protein